MKKKPEVLGRFDTVQQARAAGFKPEEFRAAGVHETMGPHFCPILWVAGRPFTRK